MKKMKAAGLPAAAVILALCLGGCSSEVLDYRNATIENGKVFAGDENEPFSGRLTNLPELELLRSQDGFKQFLRPVVRSNATLNHYGEHPGVVAMLALSQGSCDVQVADGYLEGSASCTGPGGQGKGSEMEFKGGALTGEFKYYNPAYSKALISEGTFTDGAPTGQQKVYGLETGNLLMTVVWNNGGLNGQVEKFNEQTGNRVYQSNYVDGVLNGGLKEFAPDGKRLTHVATYKEGKLQGFEDRYDPSTGEHVAHLTWVDGYLHGRVQKWDATGRTIVDTEYRYGHPASWDEPSTGSDSAHESADPNRPASTTDASTCAERWLSAYRTEAGADAPASVDQLNEWEQRCAEGKLPDPAPTR
jgi:antitoxin component YwqK of YwqJK toxin-antitoxin module